MKAKETCVWRPCGSVDCAEFGDRRCTDRPRETAADAVDAGETAAETPEQAIGRETPSREAVGLNQPAPPVREARDVRETTTRLLVGQYEFDLRRRSRSGRDEYDVIRDGRVVGIVRQMPKTLKYRSLAWDRSIGTYTRLCGTRASLDSAIVRIAIFDPETWR